MVHGILQFTPSIAFRYVLHRCESRDIRCRESLRLIEDDDAPARAPFPGRQERALSFRFLGATRAGVSLYARERAPGTKGTPGQEARRPPTLKRVLGSFCRAGSTMILPQVHLRKPCYDFSFL
ncbi:hypothetical protein ACFX1W_033924 [Malus domestica]